MIRRIRTMAAAAVTAIIITAALASSVAASAASGPTGFQAAAGSTVIFSKDVAGWQDARWTRFFTTTITLPSNATCKAMAGVSPEGFGAAITLGPAEESNLGIPRPPDASTVGISMVPSVTLGCGLISPSFASNLPGYSGANQFPAGAITLSPGDSVTLSLFYGKLAHVTKASVRDNTTGDSAQTSLTGAATYMSSSATGGFGPYASPASRSRLWLFTGTRMTTYTGVNGALQNFGPAKVIMTSNGTGSGRAEVSSPFLWGTGQNFGLYTQ